MGSKSTQLERIGRESGTPGRSGYSARIIAVAAVMATCYFAASIIETAVVSLMLAIFLDPIVELLARIRFPRALGALIAVLLLVAVLAILSIFLYNRVQDFVVDLPRYSSIIRRNVSQVRLRIDRLARQTEQVIPREPQRTQTVTLAEPSLLSQYLFPGVQTAASVLLTVAFIPFLVFFMLSWKDHLRESVIEAFSERDQPGIAMGLRRMATTMRQFLVGNILLGLILTVASSLLFLFMGMRFRIVLGLLSGFLSLIPYLGVLLAILGPVVVALPQFHSLPPYLILIGGLVGFHIIAQNVLFPKLVGSRVNLNPVAVTLALMFWGWMWGAMGLILAIPITAGAKAVCDNIEGLKKVGRFLGE